VKNSCPAKVLFHKWRVCKAVFGGVGSRGSLFDELVQDNYAVD